MQNGVALGFAAQVEHVLPHFFHAKFCQREVVHIKNGMMKGNTRLLAVDCQHHAADGNLPSVRAVVFRLVTCVLRYREKAAARRNKDVRRQTVVPCLNQTDNIQCVFFRRIVFVPTVVNFFTQFGCQGVLDIELTFFNGNLGGSLDLFALELGLLGNNQ